MINIKRLLKSFKYAIKGIIKTFKEEQNLKVQAIAGVSVVIIAIIFGVTKIEWCILLLCVMIVLLMEFINSAVERITDMFKPRINAYVKDIKDIMAAAVMLASLFSVIIGLIILMPYFLNKIWFF